MNAANPTDATNAMNATKAMNAREAAIEIGRRFGAPDFALDEQGRAAFSIDDDQHVELHADADGTVLYAMVPLGTVSAQRPDAAVFELLSANAEASAPDAPYFSLDPRSGDIVLNAAFVLRALSAESLFQRLQSLLAFAAHERARLGATTLCTA